ncbi:LacI family DNA-binding transcriptional regulator [Yinghuangia aomiensis]|uniref:LacI family DNA-binding transcriptional regulator n=1 Tax=Yinghuangia aomiensis TaxID=676205 RepID=UPI003CD08A8B
MAQAARVSVGTVSNVINHRDGVSDELRLRVRAVIDRLGYVPSESGRQLRVGHSRLVALVVLDASNPYFAAIGASAERAFRDAGLGLMICNTAGDIHQEADHLGMLVEQRVRGVLLAPADPRQQSTEILRRHKIPFVLVGRTPADGDGCSVSVDDMQGGVLAVRHLLVAGHGRIACVMGPAHLTQGQDRHRGAQAARREAGVPLDALHRIDCTSFDIESGRDAGARVLALLPRPTAVFCANDLLALGVLQTLWAAGVRVPHDVALVGYDDIEFAAAAAVPLSSVRQPVSRLGRAAADLLISETRSGPVGEHRHQRLVLQPELVVRDSSRISPSLVSPRHR